MMKKKIHPELKELIEAQCDIEGFDYAWNEKINLDGWDEGTVPDDLKKAFNKYKEARDRFIEVIKSYGVDPCA